MERMCVFVFLVFTNHAMGSERTKTPDLLIEKLVQNDEEFLPRRSDNWQEGKSLQEAMEYLFVYKVGADVTFIVTDQKGPSKGVPMTFKAHRTILTARSAIMSSLLTNATTTDPISITDVDPEAFRQMLRYMYTDQPEITANNVLYVATAARKYKMPGLQTLCGEYLRRDLTEATVLGILKQGLYFDDHSLVTNCLDLISSAASSVLSSPGFLAISLDMMARITAIEKMKASEVDLFRACLRWAGEECGRRDNCTAKTDGTQVREILEPFIYNLRFPSMGITEFTDEAVVSGVLSAEEISLIYQQMISTTPPQSPFMALNRGIPAQYPADMMLQYRQKIQNSRYDEWFRYSPSCFVNRNITLFKLHSLPFYFDYSDNKLTVKQNGKDLYVHQPYHSRPVGNDFNDDDIVSFNFTDAVNIEAGSFVIDFYVYQRRQKPKYFERDIKKQQHGQVEWWCSADKSPLYGLQYKSR